MVRRRMIAAVNHHPVAIFELGKQRIALSSWRAVASQARLPGAEAGILRHPKQPAVATGLSDTA